MKSRANILQRSVSWAQRKKLRAKNSGESLLSYNFARLEEANIGGVGFEYNFNYI